MAYGYGKDKSVDIRSYNNDDIQWKPFLRQILMASSAWSMFFCIGLVIGSPTVIIPQLRRNANVTGPVSDDMASWLSSAFSYASIPWIFILPTLAHKFGMKKTYIFICICNIGSFLSFFCSTTPIHLLITEVTFGVTQATVVSITLLIISEYTSPQYRGIFLCIKSASTFWGIWAANIIGTFTHWSYIPVLGLVCSTFCLSIIFCPESPHWLASKKRFSECKEAHILLKGTGRNSQFELDKMIRFNQAEFSLSSFKCIKEKGFYMPVAVCLFSTLQFHMSGKYAITMHAVQILKNIMKDEVTVYRTMLVLDGVTVLSTFVGCYLAKKTKRRKLLLASSTISILFLLMLSLYLYLVKLSIFDENVYVSILLLAGFSWSICCGPMILNTTLCGELVPSRYKSVSIIIYALSFVILHGTLFKVSPLIFVALSMPGTFLFYGLTSAFFLVLLYFYLPETKDKTLLEIEEYFTASKELKERMKLVT